MRAMCRTGGKWKVFGECDVCDEQLHRRYTNVPGKGSYAEQGLWCSSHGKMIPEFVVYRQNRLYHGRHTSSNTGDYES